nr:hypothetical protein [uncultured Desulfosarcina sp.]
MIVDVGDIAAVSDQENTEWGRVENKLGSAQRFKNTLLVRDVFDEGHGIAMALEFHQGCGHFNRKIRAILPTMSALEGSRAVIA